MNTHTYTEIRGPARIRSDDAAWQTVSAKTPHIMVAPPEPPVCTRTKRCKGCPYPAHGFICWSSGSQCLRTLTQRKRKSSPKEVSE